MSYYVSAINGSRKALVCGPFRRHGDALRAVPAVKREARHLFRDVCHFDTAWGTCQHRTGRPITPAVSAVNAALALELDSDGYVR